MGATYIAKGSIFFHADISRDFLLLDEIATKKLVLIGPRASGIPGVFHGPLWIYLNFPAYWFGNGNPVVVGWFWVMMTAVFFASSYWLFRQLTTKKSALMFVAMLAGMMIPWIYQMLNPFGALALMPLLVFAMRKYQLTQKIGYWALVILTLGAMTQFQMAVGGPLMIVVFIWMGLLMYRHKKLWHLVLLPLLLLPLASFILFDVRHDFSQTRAAIEFVTDKTTAPQIGLGDRLQQRIDLATTGGLYVFTDTWRETLNVVVFAALLMYFVGKLYTLSKSDQSLMKLLLFLYAGFYIVSLMFNGDLLVHYWWPLVALSYAMVAILITNAPKRWATLAVIFVLGSHLLVGVSFLDNVDEKIGNVEDDWKFQEQMTAKLFEGPEQEFGYFIFTPDVYAYESKAAMTYQIRQHPEKTVARYEKRPVTYLILAPDPKFRPDIRSIDWIRDRVRLEAVPSDVINLPDGYQILRYELTPEQVGIETEPTINDWLHFR